MNPMMHEWTAAAAILLAGMAMAAPAEAPPAPYQPLAFLVGHCWKGTFPDGKATDEHCFSWIYGGKFVRDEHVVHRGEGHADGLGESIYVWDAASKQLQYLYIESAGGFSRGTVSGEGETQTYRSRWQPAGQDAYDVVTEFQVKDGWVPGFKLHMEKVTPAKLKEPKG